MPNPDHCAPAADSAATAVRAGAAPRYAAERDVRDGGLASYVRAAISRPAALDPGVAADALLALAGLRDGPVVRHDE